MKFRLQPWLVLLGVLSILSLGGWTVFSSLRNAINEMVENDLASIATLKSSQIEQWFDDRSADAASLGSDSYFARGVQNWYASGRTSAPDREQILGQLQELVTLHKFTAAVLLDKQGRPTLVVGEREHDIHHVQVQVAQALSEVRTVFANMHRHDRGAMEMDFITPLKVQGRVVGGLYLMEDASVHLFPLLTSQANAGELVETHLVRHDGDRVAVLSPLRDVVNAPLELTLPFTDELDSAQALSGSLGLIQDARDYMGRPVLSYAVALPRMGWVMIASAKVEQAYALVNRLIYISVPVMLFLLLLTTAWFVQWQRRQRIAFEATEMQVRLAGEARFHTVFDHAALAMARLALNGDLIEVNDKWRACFGYADEEIAARGVSWNQITYPEDRSITEDQLNRLLTGDKHEGHFESRFVRKDGSVFWGETQISLVHDEEGKPDFLINTVLDISERKRFEEERNSNLALLQMAMDAAQEAVWEWDLKSGKARFSPECYTMLGYLPDEFPAEQSEWESRIHPEDRDKVLQTIQNELKQHQDIYVTEYRMQTKDGRYRWVQARGKCVEVDAKGNPMHIVGINIDIHDRKQAELQVSYLAYHDKLTGLPNRALFFDRFSQAISRGKRDRRRVALLFADLDGFKQVNDIHGHEAGDSVLRMAAQRLLACLRAVDTAVRFGGDEFAVIVSDVDDTHQVAQVAEKIVNAFEAEMTLEQGATCQIGVSIGISIYPDNGSTMDGLLTAADQAMYDSKHAGKNTYTFFGEHGEMPDEQWIKFDQSHVLGVTEIDEQHRNLVRMVNKLNSEWRKGASQASLLDLFDSLVTATAEHFETEGRYMAQYAYPEQRMHEKEHALLVDEAMRLRKGLNDGGELLALQTIKDWLINHILHSDSRLAKYLIGQGVR